MIDRGTARLRRWTFALGASVVAMSVATFPARAECAPEPTTAGGTVDCAGSDSDGLTVTTSNTVVTVAADARVTNGGAAAITVEIPGDSFASVSRLVVDGIVDGGAFDGIRALTGPNTTYFSSTTRLTLEVGESGSVAGTTALALAQTPGSQNGQVIASVTNAGTLTGTSGIALRGDAVAAPYGYSSSVSRFSSIVNTATGLINGGIRGPIGSLDNAGVIDSGALSAIALGNAANASSVGGFNDAWVNSGTIRSAGTAATVVATTPRSLTNSGTIANAGTGAAIETGPITLTNEAGGRIETAGATAIQGRRELQFVNRGIVTGDVVTTGPNNTIDSGRGLIQGSVNLAGNFNTLVMRYNGGATPVTGITGAIIVNGRNNTQQIAIDTDTSMATPIALLAGFDRFAIATDKGVTTTLGNGFVAPTTVQVMGAGTLVNDTTVVRSATAFVLQGVSSPDSQRFVNNGTIQVTSNQYAISAPSFFSQIVNNGLVAGRYGISAGQASVENNGSIVTTNTGVEMSGNALTNTGTIRSTGGTGVTLGGNVGVASTNSGSIVGATTGAIVGAYLTNTGTISATNANGVAAQLNAYGALYNEAGGVIGTGGTAVRVDGFETVVANAGTINGDVTFTSGSGSMSGSQRYISRGGTLNGNLTLTSDGVLFTDLANTGPGQFAGITGTVTAPTGAQLRYRVSGDESATLGPVGPFASATYQVESGASLLLTAPNVVSTPVRLAGTGAVTIDADLSVITDRPAISTTSSLSERPSNAGASSALAITSLGSITVTRTPGSSFFGVTGVSLTNDDTFTNGGTITVTGLAGEQSMPIAVSGGTLINNGDILLDGATGASSKLINNGRIVQIAGGAASIGAYGGNVDNRGTIDVGGTAIFAYNTGTITNSGTIASSGGVAIGGRDTSTSATISNLADATISGGAGTAIELYYGRLTNAGTILGTVDLGKGFPYYSGAPERSYATSIYVAAGGTIAGDLRFGDSADLLLINDGKLGVSGIVDGGDGRDILAQAITTSATVSLDDVANVRSFEDRLVQTSGADTVATITASGTHDGNLYLVGDGHVVNQATITGALTSERPSALSSAYFTAGLFPSDQSLASLTNEGSVGGGVNASTAAFTNAGTITGPAADFRATVQLNSGNALSFVNSGTIDRQATADQFNSFYSTASLTASSSISIDNSGTIAGNGLTAQAYGHNADLQAIPVTLDFANSGTIASAGTAAVSLLAGMGWVSEGQEAPVASSVIQVNNAGTIAAQARAEQDLPYANGLIVAGYDLQNDANVAIANSGSITATGSVSATALQINGEKLSGTITNAAGATISATGDQAFAIASQGAVAIDNAGTISANGITNSRAILVYGDRASSLRNSGAITGDILLGGGGDVVDNRGTITGAIDLGAGNDSFVQRFGSTVSGLIDGGDDVDDYVVDATGGSMAIAPGGFVNFERLTQVGTGTGSYAGSFDVDTIALDGGTLAVAAGQSLATRGAVTVTGGDAGVQVVNAGTIAGAVMLGAGNDVYTAGPGSVVGRVDGGAGRDLYRVILAGDRSGIDPLSGFEQLAVEGSGTLSLALAQSFDSVSLSGTGFTAALGGFTIGRIDGSTVAEAVTLDGDVALVALGAGDDRLALAGARAAGIYDGGAGSDALRFAATGPVTLAGTATGFETVALAGGALTVTGTLGATGDAIAFGDGAQSLSVARGGTLAGTVDLGAGDDSFRLATGATLAGTVAGGGGTDSATLALDTAFTLTPGKLTGFERLTTEGGGALTLAGGAFGFDRVTAGGDVTIAADTSLAAQQLVFGPSNDRLVIAGGFTGSVAGGAGSDTIEVSGGSAATPVAFGTISDVEALRMSAGFTTIAGNAAVGTLALTGGRLVGLAGSSITAPTITVASGATFGSAGTVTGNLAIAGTLSPGASPGTMTVNGNVALGATSRSLFEITPTVSDRLIVNGALSIAQGATLQLVAAQPVLPGQSLDLIVASGGITGSYSNVIKPDSLFGFLVQQNDRLSLLGQFRNNATFAPQVQRSVGYVNAVLTGGRASPALLAAAPRLLTSDGATNAAAFAQIAPEAYAAARHVSVDQGLALASTGRGAAFATQRVEAGPFTFGSMLAGARTLESGADGTARTQTNGYGLLGGIGWGSADWSIGGFVGWVDTRQSLADRGARTTADGIVAGVHARWNSGALGVKATIAYDGTDATTRRALPVGDAVGRYDLTGWTGDLSVDYAVPLSNDWMVTPRVGVTAIRTTRGRVGETGNSPFALDVARQRETATFVDGALTFSGGEADAATVRPYLSIGVRYQIDGRTPTALAALGGGGLGLLATGASRAPVLATATLGSDVALTSRLALFGALSGESGDADKRASARAGLRLSF